MPKTQQLEQVNDLSKQSKQAFDAVISEQVLHLLGTPDDLYKLQVHRLWDGHYRVNIFLGANAASVRIAESYFIVVDGEGNIASSAPPITRKSAGN